MEALLVWLLLMMNGRKKKPVAEKPSSGALSSGTALASAWKSRVSGLLERARSGARWQPELAKYLPSGSTAAARWVGIESGGNPRGQSALNERGLAQAMKSSVPAAEWAKLIDPATTDAEHARLAVAEIKRAVAGGLGSKTDPSPTDIGSAKVYHGLPLLVRELKTQGLWRSDPGDTLIAMLRGFRIPAGSTLPRYVSESAHRLTGNTVHNLALRFLAPALVVARAESALAALERV